jgi:hypothetical protein
MVVDGGDALINVNELWATRTSRLRCHLNPTTRKTRLRASAATFLPNPVQDAASKAVGVVSRPHTAHDSERSSPYLMTGKTQLRRHLRPYKPQIHERNDLRHLRQRAHRDHTKTVPRRPSHLRRAIAAQNTTPPSPTTSQTRLWQRTSLNGLKRARKARIVPQGPKTPQGTPSPAIP